MRNISSSKTAGKIAPKWLENVYLLLLQLQSS